MRRRSLAIVGTVVALAGVACLTIFRREPLSPLFAPDGIIGYRPKPGAVLDYAGPEFQTRVQINAVGVRDEPLVEKAPNEYRILVLGNSMTMALEVDLHETFAKRLEQSLDDWNPGIRYHVIDGGVTGYGPVEEFLYLCELVDAIQPDTVVLAVVPANDAVLSDSSAHRLEAFESRSTENLATDRWNTRGGIARAIARVLPTRVPAREFTLPRTASRDTWMDVALAVEVAHRVGTLARLHGATIIVALLADRAFRNDARIRMYVDALGGTELPVLNLLSVLGTQRGSVFFRQDGHLSPRGHQVVSDALTAFAIEQGLLNGSFQ
jgi:hypothetical protein